MAIAPCYMQARLLYAAIGEATLTLKAPIVRVEVTSGKVRFWARTRFLFWPATKKLTISFQYVGSPSFVLGALPSLLLDGECPADFDDTARTDDTALPPWSEREELLSASVSKAITDLQAPIDRIVVTSDKVLLWAGSKELTIAYEFLSKRSERLKCREFLLDGEDHW